MSDLKSKSTGLRFEPVVAKPIAKEQPGFWSLVWGVILPAGVIVFELASGFCAQNFFDPMPTIGHAFLISSVPLSNFLVWRYLRNDGQRTDVSGAVRRWLVLGNGAAIAIAAFYALIFLPMVPLALLATVVGIGFLPLSPALSLLAAFYLRRVLAQSNAVPRPGLLISGMAIGLVAVMAVDVPAAATRLGVQWAASDDATERERGLRLLRTLGDEDLLRRLSYDTTGRPSGPLSGLVALSNSRWLEAPDTQIVNVSPTKVREIYYRATGEAFNAKPAPVRSGRGLTNDFVWDNDHGGTHVGGRLAGLSAVSSRIDGSVSAADQVAYLEWILEFRNVSPMDREARLQMLLPPGGVVSRATLWVNGEEREAAYGGRAEVRAAYEKVAVIQRRDPLLVTTKGADRVLLQAFPVGRNGGTIKFKVGITAPVELDGSGKGRVVLPAIMDRNFSMGSDFCHGVWIAGQGAMTASADGLTAAGSGGDGRVTGALTDGELAGPRPSIQVDTGAESVPGTIRQARFAGGDIVAQTVTSGERASGFMLVIDGSARMATAASDIARAIERLPADAKLGAVVASEPLRQVDLAPASDEQKRKVMALLQSGSFKGGQDNAPALTAALMATEFDQGLRLLWVHGPQPVAFSATAATLEQAISRLSRVPQVTLYGVEAGPNELLPDAPWGWRARTLPMTGSVEADLAAFFARELDAKRPVLRRDVVASPNAAETGGSDHIVRLWAKDRIIELASSGGEDKRKAAVDLAVKHRLVTPVSGAVVLESQQQYDDSNLKPVEKASVPTIPEPHEWALIIVACAMLMWLAWRRRQGICFGTVA